MVTSTSPGGGAPRPTSPQDVVALYRAGRRAEALEGCRQLLAATPGQPQLLVLAGRIAMDLGEPAQAVEFYEAALKVQPESTELLYSLGNALLRLERPAAAVDVYRRAARLLVPVYNNLAIALQSLGRWDEAVDTCRQAVALAPGSAELHRNLGIALEGAGQRAAAIAAYRQAAACKPEWLAPYRNLATALLEDGDAKACLETCATWLQLAPGTLEAIGLTATALDEIGDRAGARRLVDIDRFLRVVQFDRPPPGFDSLKAFNQALSRDVMAHPKLVVPTESEPHYNGPGFRTTPELFGPTTGPWAALQKIFTEQVADYLAKEARPDQSHPYLSHPPQRWWVSAVGTVLDRLSALAPHVHYDGYVSGVYYTQLPDTIGAPGTGQAGWLEIGRPQKRFHRRGTPEIRAVQPREGTMVLFPSYFLHNTVPFEAGAIRISIAFDAIPATDGAAEPRRGYRR